MVSILLWWFITSVLAIAALPLTRRLFRPLADEGYTFARSVGLLLASYILWLGCSLGFLLNTPANALFSIAVMAAFSWVLGPRDIGAFLRRQRAFILRTEALFAIAFFAFAYFRSYSPEILGTEKPMEFAFLNAILRSRNFPPHDPWLSGFAISYYYFGYVMMAFLTKLSGVASGMAFNLGIALLFALTVTGSFGVVYNVIRQAGAPSRRAITYALLGALFVGLIGNLEGGLELLRCKGVGSATFWEWVDVKGLAQAPACPQTWHPAGHWWWWRASRVIHDRNLLGQDQEVIDEFPFFSFLLGDMHPHVLALPFVMVAIGLAFSAFLSPSLRTDRFRLALCALILGGLSFLNTWDFPIYLALVVAACTLALHHRRSLSLYETLEEGAYMGLLLGIGGVLLYIPFYIGFRSQAGGILPVLFNTTKVHQYFIMFGLFVVIGLMFLAKEFLSSPVSRPGRGFWFATTGALFFMFLCLLLKRVLPATLVPVMLTCTALLFYRKAESPEDQPYSFALLLFLSGIMLTFAVEFVYIKDSFGTRMNTVFKFYYQAWVQMSIAGAFGVYALLEGRKRLSSLPRLVFAAVVGMLMLPGLYYTLAASATRMFVEAPIPRPTLDGTAYLAETRPDDYEAILWLNENVRGAPVILEATGGSYSEYAFISAFTGLPTVLGWDFHEYQWRGTYDEPSRRRPDIERIYTTTSIEEASRLMDKYGIEYIYIGPLEKRAYHLSPPMVEKFAHFMKLVYENSGVKIFRRKRSPPQSLSLQEAFNPPG